MKSVKRAVDIFLAEEDGASAVEYAVLVGLVVVAVVAGVKTLGSNAGSFIDKAATATTPSQ